VMLAIFALAVLSVITSVHTGASVRFLTGNFVKTVILAGILAASVRDRRDIDRLLRIFVLGGAAYVAAALAYGSPEAGRLSGRGSYDPNDVGLYTVCTLPLCVYLMRRGSPWLDRLIGLGSAALLLFGTVQTGSRGGFLGLIAVACFGLLGLSAVRVSKRLTVTIVGLALMLIVGGDAYWARIQTILNPQKDYNWSGQAESGRIEVWKRGVGYMLRRPILGVGVDQFQVAEGTMAPQAARQRIGIGFKWSTAHNSYIQIGAELGVIGLGLFIGMLALAFREARRIGQSATARDDRLLGQCFAALVVGFAVGGTFLSQAYGTYLYFALALLIGLSRVAPRGRLVPATSWGAYPGPVVPTRALRGRPPTRRGGLGGPTG